MFVKKRFFEEPECEIVRFSVEDVITTSDDWFGNMQDGEDGGDSGDGSSGNDEYLGGRFN